MCGYVRREGWKIQQFAMHTILTLLLVESEVPEEHMTFQHRAVARLHA